MWETNGGPIVYADLGIASGYAEVVKKLDFNGPAVVRFIGTVAHWPVINHSNITE